MCTVTFIPAGDTYLITSNRDEKSYRKQAMAPAIYHNGDVSLLYPKDADAGGTWIAVSDKGQTGILLNGAFHRHIPKPPYKKSRGLALLDILLNETPLNKFLRFDLENIEPFTLILLDNTLLHECRWDGHEKYHRLLEKTRPLIWSSATLYDEEVAQKRQQWFEKWLKNNPIPSIKDALDFHQFGGDGDEYNDLRMNRDGKVFTVSVTGIELNNEKAVMHYLDLKDNKTHRHQMHFMRHHEVA
jgi:hypothetical protein